MNIGQRVKESAELFRGLANCKCKAIAARDIIGRCHHEVDFDNHAPELYLLVRDLYARNIQLLAILKEARELTMPMRVGGDSMAADCHNMALRYIDSFIAQREAER